MTKEKITKITMAALVVVTVTSTVAALATAPINPVSAIIHAGVLVSSCTGMLLMLKHEA